MNHVFIVGRVFDFERHQWSIHGVFDTQAAAVNACTDDKYFVSMFFVNVPVSNGNIDSTIAYYPLRPKAKAPTGTIENLPGRSKPKRTKNE